MAYQQLRRKQVTTICLKFGLGKILFTESLSNSLVSQTKCRFKAINKTSYFLESVQSQIFRLIPDPECTCNCGLFDHVNSRIVHGNLSQRHQFPYQVLILRNKTIMGERTRILCGGTLISKRDVLTAAHCVTYINDDYSYTIADINEFECFVNEHKMVSSNSLKRCALI